MRLTALACLVLLACDTDGGDVRKISTARVQTTVRNDVGAPEDVDAVEDVLDGADDATQGPDVLDATHTDTVADTTTPDTSVADTLVMDTTAPDTTVTDPGPLDINTNFIGGACRGDADCAFASGACLTDGDGWPNGTCTEPCTRTCPDKAGLVTTFCIDGGDFDETGGICVQKCDFSASSTGCRQGYHCVSETRFNEPQTLSYVCVPGQGELEVSGCIQELIAKGIGFELASNPMDIPENAQPGQVCDVLDPIRVNPVIDGVEFRASDFDGSLNKLFVQCPVALALWDTVQLAKQYGITKIVHYGTYNCRAIAGSTTLSQHAFANAIDLAGFETSDGKQWTILHDWDHCDPDTEAGEFLYWLGVQLHAQHVWNIILDPEYNADHEDHYHVDLTPNADFFATCH